MRNDVCADRHAADAFRAQAQEMIRKTAARRPAAYPEDQHRSGRESAGSKLDKARELGVRIIDEAQFCR
ncbi:MAG: hypothetical protein ACLUI3_11235 [Christensenellales bacterium]